MSRFGALWLIALILAMPYAAMAQSSGGRGFRMYGLDAEARARVEALGETRIEALPIPVLFGVELSNLTKNFGDPRGDESRFHEGLDILAPEGTPVASPTDAVVLRVGSGASSGLYVRTLNPGGESFVYMHLVASASDLKAGDSVKRGDIIGFVGNTGNASGGPSHLHFEIRKDGAQDPYPRLVQTFTLEERMRGLEQALARGAAGHAAMYASRFAATLAQARTQGLAVPQAILALLDSAPAQSAPTPVASAPSANGELVFNETNAKVAELQKFLIAAASGEAGARLARADGTGYFGAITQAALVEYQRAAGLSPSGVVDSATYTQIFALTADGDSSETLPEGESEESTSMPVVFLRDLELGMQDEDVRELQKFLNTRGFLVAESGDGSSGNETDYFGTFTRAALARFQAAQGIAPAAGYFGPITRGHIALLQ